MPKQKIDNVTAPAHYMGDGIIECKHGLKSMMSAVKIKLSATLAFWWGCAFKYLWRWHSKNGVEDLKKCRECIDNMIEEIESTQAPTGVLTERRD